MRRDMVRRVPLAAIASCAMVTACLGHSAPGGNRIDLPVAEDLWGNRLDLAGLESGVTLIQPFSPSACGYCLFDGEFVAANYFEPNAASGGANFYQCLFSPQLDIYTFVKHYRHPSVPVLTFPPALHNHHRDGYPWISAFRHGRAVYLGSLHPYEETFRRLSAELWPDSHRGLTLTSPLHMAGRFVLENGGGLGVMVIPDGDEAAMRAAQEGGANRSEQPVTPRFEGQLRPEDRRKNLLFSGRMENFRFDALSGNTPITIDATSVRIGAYVFPRADVGVRACFPNPNDPERYVMLNVFGEHARPAPSENWLDFVVRGRVDAAGEAPLLLHGRFAKRPGNLWEFADSLAFASGALAAYCRGGCPVRDVPRWEPHAGESRLVVQGPLYTLGAAACRFPRVAAGDDGYCWIVWEEAGDVFLARVGGDGLGGQARQGWTARASKAEGAGARPVAIEHDGSDSFSPLVVAAGREVWVFYLNDRDGQYRLYARRFDGMRLSPPALVSEPGPFDVVTPAATATPDGRIVVFWSEWKANSRYPRYRTIVDGALGDAQAVAICKPPIDYTNAWWPSLACDAGGRIHGAWNQHYPATIGVCSGDLVHPAVSVTRIQGDIQANENGGYPSIAIAGDGATWVFWQSYGRVVLSGERERILAARETADADTPYGRWSLPVELSDERTFFNRTPRAAVAPDGTIWVVWSGRDREGRDPWRVYVAHSGRGEDWSPPQAVSPEGVSARAPDVAVGRQGEVWISWHAGVGDRMRAQVMRYAPQDHRASGA